MSDDYLVRNCAPTLAGLKTGNMFSCPYESREDLLNAIRQLNKRLSAKGSSAARIGKESACLSVSSPIPVPGFV